MDLGKGEMSSGLRLPAPSSEAIIVATIIAIITIIVIVATIIIVIVTIIVIIIIATVATCSSACYHHRYQHHYHYTDHHREKSTRESAMNPRHAARDLYFGFRIPLRQPRPHTEITVHLAGLVVPGGGVGIRRAEGRL